MQRPRLLDFGRPNGSLDDDRGYAALSKQLQDRGRFSAEQADALAETIGAVITETLATKRDIAAIRAEISGLRSELKAKIAELRSNLQVETSEVKTATVELKAELLK